MECLLVSSLKIVWTISASSMEKFKTVILDCQNLTYTRDFFTGGNAIMDYGLVFWPEVMV